MAPEKKHVTPNQALRLSQRDLLNQCEAWGIERGERLTNIDIMQLVAKAGLSVPAFTKIMQYFICHLRARKGSLAAWMLKEVITPAILDSKSKRASFLDAWSKQRSTEFVPKKRAKQD